MHDDGQKCTLRHPIVEGQLVPGAKGQIRKYVTENPMDVFVIFLALKTANQTIGGFSSS